MRIKIMRYPFREDWGLHIMPWHLKSLYFLEKLLSNKEKGNEVRILDIGVGKGKVTLFIKSYLERLFPHLKIRFYAVDCVDKFELKNIPFNIVDLNYQKLPFPNDYFDVILAFEVIEHLIVPENLVKESYRILKPKGVFVLSVPNLRWWRNILLLLGYQPYNVGSGYFREYGTLTKIMKPCHHLKAYTPRAIMELLLEHKFRILYKCGVEEARKSKDSLWLIEKIISLFFSEFSNDTLIISDKSKNPYRSAKEFKKII